MEFPFITTKVLGSDSSGFSVLQANRYPKSMQKLPANYSSARHQGEPTQNPLDEILDKMGAASARAQSLPQVITTAMKFQCSGDNKIYILARGKTVIGFIKTGRRTLFHRMLSGDIKEINPVCVLDFYVHESVQRGGHGKAIFQKMLRDNGNKPQKLAYDRPSSKLIGFLQKHYGLKSFISQNNNFVVFDAYFENSSLRKSSSFNYMTAQPEKQDIFQMDSKKSGVRKPPIPLGRQGTQLPPKQQILPQLNNKKTRNSNESYFHTEQPIFQSFDSSGQKGLIQKYQNKIQTIDGPKKDLIKRRQLSHTGRQVMGSKGNMQPDVKQKPTILMDHMAQGSYRAEAAPMHRQNSLINNCNHMRRGVSMGGRTAAHAAQNFNNLHLYEPIL